MAFRGSRLLGGATVWLVAVFFFSAAEAYADGPMGREVGTAALVSGRVWVRHGEILLKPKPDVRFHDNYEKMIGPNDAIHEGDVVLTEDDSYVKIYYRDDSIMDVGPSSTFKVDRFEREGALRDVRFSVLVGKIRTLVTRPLEGSGSYRVATPLSVLGVRGTEFVVHAFAEKSQYHTDITCMEGKVLVDVPKVGEAGKVYLQPVLVTPGNSFSGSGLPGSPVRYDVSRLTGTQLERVAMIVPAVEDKRGGVAAPPAVAALPGTGVAPRGRRAPASLTAEEGAGPKPLGIQHEGDALPTLGLQPSLKPPAVPLPATPPGQAGGGVTSAIPAAVRH